MRFTMRRPGRGLLAAVGALAMPVTAARPAAISAPGLVVNTTEGRLKGVRESGTIAFLGVPFAAPPVGQNRWRAPQPAARWNGIREATTYSASCMQRYPAPAFGPYTREFLDSPKPSEDCLYLNVWRPASAASNLPVLVWIHGGAFLGGSAAMSIYNGSALAAKGVVVVSINYRVGPFGFLAHPLLTAENGGRGSGNYGLLDQIQALRWVKSNIRNFGGDPGRVTIAGQSAGAASVNDLMLAPGAVGLFQRAIAESGSGMGFNAEPLAVAENEGVSFAKYLGANSLAELRALPAEKIQAAVYFPIGPQPVAPPPKLQFKPVLDGVLPQDSERGTSRPMSNVPFITGFNANDGPAEAVTTAEQFITATRARYGKHADSLLALYPHATDTEAVASAKLLARDKYMASLIIWTDARMRNANQKIYRYMYVHPTPAPPGGRSFGAFHTAEVPYVFGMLDRKLRKYGTADDQISARMQGYWINFMAKGNPNGPALPAWPKASSANQNVMALGEQWTPRPAVSSESRLEALRAFVADGGQLSLF